MDTKTLLAFIDRIVTHSNSLYNTKMQLAQLKRILEEQDAPRELIYLINPDDALELTSYAGKMSVEAIKEATQKAKRRREYEAQHSRC